MVNESLQRQIAAERFAILKKQESGVYACVEYLDPEFQRKQLQQQTYSGPNASIFDSLSNDSSTGSLNEVWREKICEWCYQVVDHFDFSREVVGISMSFLDRYLSTRRVNKKIFQLAAMTCLYLAIKLHEPGSLKISSLIALSRGFFTKSHVLAMEESILRALEFRVHPPTVMDVIREYVALLSPDIGDQTKCDVNDLASFLSELSVCDYFFVGKKQSNIALACVLTAFEGIKHDRLPRCYRQRFVDDIYRLAKINCTVKEVHECRLRLRDIYQLGGYSCRSSLERDGNQSPNNVKRANERDSAMNEHEHTDSRRVLEEHAVKHVAMESSFVDASCN